MHSKLLIPFVAVFFALGFTASEDAGLNLEEISPDLVKQIIEEEDYVLILFTKNADCADECRKKEESLLKIRMKLREVLDAWVIRTTAPSLLQEMGGDASTDFIVFVRNQKPLFYTGPLEEKDELLRYFITYKDSNVKSISDGTFEHETQASSGATTGDWLVFFIKDDCEKCDELIGHIETTAAALKNRKNVALMHRESDSAVTTRRFGVTSFPYVILFHLGNMYRYSFSSMNHTSLTAFAEDGFRNTQREVIPLPKDDIADFVVANVEWVNEHLPSWLTILLIFTFGTLLLHLFISHQCSLEVPDTPTKKNKNKKNN